MIKFTDLRVQKEHLIIAAEVEEIEDYFDDVYIDKIFVDTQDTFITSGPSANTIYSATVSGNLKEFSLTLTSADLNNIDLENTMFFVHVKAKGTPSPPQRRWFRFRCRRSLPPTYRRNACKPSYP